MNKLICTCTVYVQLMPVNNPFKGNFRYGFYLGKKESRREEERAYVCTEAGTELGTPMISIRSNID
jgi:hypothetical protein